jgi:hypothetical protein
MKSIFKLLPLITLFAMLPGCSGWVWLDGSSVDGDSLDAARHQCKIEERMQLLEQAEDEYDEKESQAETEKARMKALEEYQRVRRLTDAEIRSCMRKLGLKPTG